MQCDIKSIHTIYEIGVVTESEGRTDHRKECYECEKYGEFSAKCRYRITVRNPDMIR